MLYNIMGITGNEQFGNIGLAFNVHDDFNYQYVLFRLSHPKYAVHIPMLILLPIYINKYIYIYIYIDR